MDVACYHSVGVDTAMLYNGTTLNKALLLDWPVTLWVHLLNLQQPHNFQCQKFSRNTRQSFLRSPIPDRVCVGLFFCGMFWSRPVCAPSNPGMPQDTTAQGKGTGEKGAVTELQLGLRLSSGAALFLYSPFH